MEQLRIPKIDAPSDVEKIAQIRSYLYQLIPQLQVILSELEGEKIASASGGDVCNISVGNNKDTYTLEIAPSGMTYKKNGSVLWKK